MTFHTWLQQATVCLQASSQLPDADNLRREAEILLMAATAKSRSFILAFGETLLTDEQQQQLAQLLSRRVSGEPVAYLLGEREFWSLPLRVSPATLIPRPDTECLVQQALFRLPDTPCEILDLGTGTGAIALALAKERPYCQVTALDIVAQAVKLAQDNAQRLGLNNVQVLQSNWFSALAHSGRNFAMIVANPPYIAADDWHLLQGDLRFEPRSALVADNQGLADLQIVIHGARTFLRPAGWLLLEHGWQQGAAVRELLHQANYQHIETCFDYGGNERVSVAQWLPGDSGCR